MAGRDDFFIWLHAIMSKPGYVYILASGRNGTLYVGVSNNLVRRVGEHKQGTVPGFTKQHRVHRLVYFEEHDVFLDAIEREKQIKLWKIRLIESFNPSWAD